MVGRVLAAPPVIVTEPCALRKPLAVAKTVYVPAGACRLKVPSGLAFTVAANELSALYKLTVTGLLASTSPVRDPEGIGVGDASGVDVNVGVGETSGVNVNVGVGDSTGVEVAVADPSGVEVAVADPSGVEVAVADPSGVEVTIGVGDSIGVDVGVTPVTVRLAAVEGRFVSTLSPLETRAVHSIADWPACRAVTVKVNTVPLVVALLPLLPAIATMKLPFAGPLIAVAASAPKRPATRILLASIKFAS